MRSPNYPAVGLGEAVNLSVSLWGREKRSYAPAETIVQAWGYSGLSGNARTKIAAMRKYGLLEENNDGYYRLSDRAVNILHNPLESEERLAALREAALSPELFSELQQTSPDASDETIRSYLMTKKGFSDTGADTFIKAFRDTQETAKLGSMATATLPAVRQEDKGDDHSAVEKSLFAAKRRQERDDAEAEGKFYRWPLSRSVTAEVRFVGKVTPAHLDLLKQYLEVAKTAMEIIAAETPAVAPVMENPNE